MRHKDAGWKLGRNTATGARCCATWSRRSSWKSGLRPRSSRRKRCGRNVEKMITLGKRGDLAARRQAAAYLMTGEAVRKLFDTVAPRYRRSQRRLSAHHSYRLAEGRWRRKGFHRTSGQREGAGREAPEARRSPLQACRRNQESHGRSGSGAGSSWRGTRVRWRKRVSRRPFSTSATHPSLGAFSFCAISQSRDSL